MPALNKKALLAEIERDRRKKLAERLKALRALIKDARAKRREAIAGVKTQCKVAREKLRTVCGNRVARAKESGAQAIVAGLSEAAEEREIDRLLRTADRRGRGVVRARSSSRERQQESDEEVANNLPEAMQSVWNTVKRHIKPTARKSRTEAFLQWAEENVEEVYAIQSQNAERELAQMIAEHEQAERLSRRRGRLAAGDVPF